MRSKTGKTTRMLGRNPIIFLIVVILLLPLILPPIGFIFIGNTDLWPLMLMIAIPWFAFFFYCGAPEFLGLISFSEDKLTVRTVKPRCFSLEPFAFRIDYHDICGISFRLRDGDRNDEVSMKMRAWDVAMVELTANDDSKRYILLFPFAKKQWIRLENELLKRNPEILVLDTAKELIEKTKLHR